MTTLLGALGMWLMLPRGTARGRGVGIVLATIALGLGASQVPRLGDWTADGVFLVLAAVTVVSAAAAVTFRNPVYCAIWFGQSLLGTAGLFFFTGAQFLAVATVVVYAGAILVTFLFVLMLAQPEGKAPYDRVSWEALISAATGIVIVGVLSMTIGGVFSPAEPPAAADRSADGRGFGRRHPHAAARRPAGRRVVRPALDRGRSGRDVVVGGAGGRGRDCGSQEERIRPPCPTKSHCWTTT